MQLITFQAFSENIILKLLTEVRERESSLQMSQIINDNEHFVGQKRTRENYNQKLPMGYNKNYFKNENKNLVFWQKLAKFVKFRKTFWISESINPQQQQQAPRATIVKLI